MVDREIEQSKTLGNMIDKHSDAVVDSMKVEVEKLKEQISLLTDVLINKIVPVIRKSESFEASFEKTKGQIIHEIMKLSESGRFDRQAIHDLSVRVFGGKDTSLTKESLQTIGVVMPTCDRPGNLRSALTSLTEQTRKPDKVAVVNDGSVDISSVLEDFAHDLSILVLATPEPYSGSSVARNIGLESLNTSYIAFLDDDNLMFPSWLEKAAGFLSKDEKIDILYGAQLRDDAQLTTVKNWFFEPFDFQRLKQGNFIDLNQIVHRRSVVRFAPDLRRLVDWDYILQLVSLAPEKVACVDAISSVYSTQNENRISVNYWPPDLDQLLAARGSVAQSILPSDVHVCSCCGYTGRFFSGPNGRPNAGCPQCGSLERHRFLLLLSMALRSYWVPETRRQDSSCLIEIAPSHATQKLRSLFGHDITVDAFPDADKRSVSLIASLTDLPLPSASADMLVALHVLEHIPDDKKAMAEIARVLTTAGVSILQVSMSACEATDEEIIEDPEVRKIRYGQADHVRFYGKDFYARLKACGLYSLAISPKESMLPESIAKYALAPDEVLVFVVRNDTPDAKAALDRFGRSLKKGAMIKT